MTMKNTALAFALALALGACASMDAGTGDRGAARAVSGTQYCWQERLQTTGGKHSCNWSTNKRDACDGALPSTVEGTRYSAPRKSTMCSNGQWLVEVSPAG
jgi:hypothetical protein